MPSSLANRSREQAMPKGESEAPSQPKGRPLATDSLSDRFNHSEGPRMSRNSSTNTVFQIHRSPPVAYQTLQADPASSQKARVENHEPYRKLVETSTGQRKQSFERPRTPPPKVEGSSTSSSPESDSGLEAEAPMSRSRAYTRRPRYSSSKPPLDALSDADEDLESSTPFLPFSEAKDTTKSKARPSDPSATLRIPPKAQASQSLSPKAGTKSRQLMNPSQNINSSSSSAQSQPARPPKAPLSSLSPRQRRLAKEGSDGTPSMGSSFSDLDDASVTQSALEEALANEMTHGGVASRMSSISQALRSRYL